MEPATELDQDVEHRVSLSTVLGECVQQLVEFDDVLFDGPMHGSTGEPLGPTLLSYNLGNDQRTEALKERPMPAVSRNDRREKYLKIGRRDGADPALFVHRNGETFVPGAETLDRLPVLTHDLRYILRLFHRDEVTLEACDVGEIIMELVERRFAVAVEEPPAEGTCAGKRHNKKQHCGRRQKTDHSARSLWDESAHRATLCPGTAAASPVR